MKGERLVILAGGISSRMKKHCEAGLELDLTLISDAANKSKAMIGLGEAHRPFLDYLLFNAQAAGYTDIEIVIGADDNSIKNYYLTDNGNGFNHLNISYAIQSVPGGREKPLGTADALIAALRDRLDWRGEKFTVCNSDNLYSVEALKTVLDPAFPNMLIDYDRSSLDFPIERIEGFAVTVKDKNGYLEDIIEKPSKTAIDAVKNEYGFVGVSMNLFRLDYNMIYPFLEKCPFNMDRNEKELPTAIKMMTDKFPGSLFAYRMNEHVPDLTNRHDIAVVRKYIKEHFNNGIFTVPTI